MLGKAWGWITAGIGNEWRRQPYLMLDAYRADRAHPIPERLMTTEQLYDAMVQLGKAS